MLSTRTLLLLSSLLTASTAMASEVKVALTADILSTNPGVTRDDNTDGVMLNIVEGLVGYGEGGTVKPLLAKSVDISKDGLVYTFKLRSGITFHNGAALTSADVLWNWTRYTNPATKWRCLPDVDGTNGVKVTSVEAPDTDTVVMHIDKPNALFLDTLARTDCGGTAILNSASLNADGSWNKPIGTGPFVFVDWKKGQSISLKKFDHYVSPEGTGFDGYVGNKVPKVDTVTFVEVPDASTVKAALLSGGVDVAQALTSDVAELKTDKGIVVITPSDASKHAILFQTKDPLFSDVKFRQAIVAALDLNQLVGFASDGLSSPSSSAVFAASPYNDAVQKSTFQYDPQKAKQLLAESGYKGQPIKLIANKRAPMPSSQVALVAQSMLQAAGINVEIEILEWATQLEKYNSGDYQMMSFSYSSRLDPALSFEQFAGDKTKQPRKVWDNAKALALIDQAKVVTDPQQRQQIFDQLHQMMLADAPLIILYNGLTAWAYRDRVENFKPWEGKPRLWGMTVNQ
ncbi:ABC transporter substrate-binding protein [Rhizobium sp. P38BS-XIX]|uniref:ABC transporter substrate-binding protein n=1 Tax=Rhizobium sp. P38BS-XIX TaxID=2726740 RepID=UPI0014566B6A|nr:ABC transporter substrate-binding protein [Rhizobium sp. P38BS-XIX]NLR99895.1 ABC transporter substrate-binding protein [Rhizobium sp. P38BS-XIX]